MDSGEKKGWSEIIIPKDLDIHLLNIGQAKINSEIILQLFSKYPLNNKSKLLVPGCGTCQMFDFFEPKDIGIFNYIFTDINSSFFKLIKKRMSKFSNIKYEFIIDNIESTKLKEKINGILAVLLLEHIEWKKGINSFIKLNP